MSEIKMELTIATADMTRTSGGRLCTEEILRRAAGGAYRYHEDTRTLVYHGPNCHGAVYTFPPNDPRAVFNVPE